MSKLIDDLLKLCNQKRNDWAFDLLCDAIDNWALAGEFEKIDDFLCEIEIQYFPVKLLLSVLTMTLPFRDKIKKREDFRSDVCCELIHRHYENYDELLEGL